MADMCYYGNVILHLQHYSHRLNLLYFFPSNAHNVKKRRVIEIFLNLRKLLQHVSVYKETVIREPQSVFR